MPQMPEFPYKPPMPKPTYDIKNSPVRYISENMSLIIRREPGFRPVNLYPYDVLVLPNEIGHYNGTRIVVH
jgi:hypothetical protein